MNADLLAMLGGAGIQPNTTSNRNEDDTKSILSFNAGKMDPVLQPNGKYKVTADPRRGEVSLVLDMISSTLKIEWTDRRTRAVVDSLEIMPEDRCTFGRVANRVYLLQFGSNPDRRFFYWMQEACEDSASKDEQNCRKVNVFLSDINECIVAAGGDVPASSSANTNNRESGSDQQQVDALSNILENLGYPPVPSNNNSTNVTSSTNGTNLTTPALSGTLTLADLQGAMAGINTTTPTSLADVANADSIIDSGLLEDASIRERLMNFLPEDQRTEEHLMDTLRCPQVRQALHTLTAALTDGGYPSILANFQLDAQDGAAAMASGNPIQAFLDCILASVKRENDQQEGQSNVESESKIDGDDQNDTEMKDSDE